jgi:malonyl-CoA O-methyltransferase
MRELKGLGEHNVATSRLRGLTGKKRMNQVLNAYEKFRRNDRYPASYEVIYGIAFAPSEGQPMKTPQGDVAIFSVDQLLKHPRKNSSS